MDISVIIPTYKPQNYLWECLNSLKNQTFQKNRFEIIIVLNGCYEPYYTKLSTYISSELKGMNTMFIFTKTPGVSNARNIALNIASGEYITFIDDDDLISPKYLEELYSIASPDTIALSYSLSFRDGTNIFKASRITKAYNKLSIYRTCKFIKARKYFGGPVYKLIHRNIIGDRRFNLNFSNNEDSIFMFLISDKFSNVVFTSTNAAYYRRIRKDSAVTRYRPPLEVIIHSIKVVNAYVSIYYNNIENYSLIFFITRVLGTFKGLAISLLNIKNRK